MKQKLKIQGMSCNHCVKRVTNSLTSVVGVSKVEVSLTDALAVVEFDETKASIQALKDAVEDAGYVVVK
jgi:copper ion binding protein